jgi:hypothetical protein
MSNLETHEAEQAAITAQCEAVHITLTPCERAQQIMDETWRNTDQNHRRAARIAIAILPAYDDDTAKTGIQDALSDILHLCDVAGWDFAEMEQGARRTYSREVLELGVAADADLRRALEEH